jgi:antitoxin ParD1/3/4
VDIPMTKVLLSLPDPLGAWAERQAANNNFDSVSDYVESLLLKEQQEQESLAELDRLIQEGEDSGISDRSIEDILAEARQEAKKRSHAGL